MNFEGSEAGGSPLRSLPFDQEKFLARCISGTGHMPIPPDPESGELDRASQRENLMMAKEKYSISYCRFSKSILIHHLLRVDAWRNDGGSRLPLTERNLLCRYDLDHELRN